MVDLVTLARRGRRSRAARWELAGRPEIRQVILGQIKRLARGRVDAEDLISAAMIGIVQHYDPAREFQSDKHLLAYYSKAVRDWIVPTSISSSPDQEISPWPSLEDDASFDDDFGEESEADRLSRQSLAYLAAYPDTVTGNAFWYRVQGLAVRQIAEILGLKAEEVSCRIEEFRAYVQREFVERGEALKGMSILSVYVEDDALSAVILRGKEMSERWSGDVETVEDYREVRKRLHRLLRRGVTFAVVNEREPCELSALVCLVFRERRMPWEEFDLALLAGARGVIDRVGREPWPVQMAYLMARAKSAENDLKAERYG